jgi:RNA 2',3'-cyclic 3'-phosphodiesterase
VGHESKRLFIAVDIDETTREQVGRISTGLREVVGPTKASWVRQDRMHLTLHFFGSADATLEAQVRDTLADSIAEPPFDVSFDGLGFFPERGSPRVLWLGVVAGLEQLRRLHRALVIRGDSPARQSHAGGSFNPHLTLARFRDRLPPAKVAEIADIRALAGPARIDRVTLYESRLSPAGPTYVPLAEALLIPSG